MKRICKSLIISIYAILIATIIWGCLYGPAIIPEELRGIYKTTHRNYDDKYFELKSRLVTVGFDDKLFKYYTVKKLKKEVIDNKTLFTILCVHEDEEEEFNFAFFADFTEEVIIHFKNKPKVAWKKKVA